MDLGWLWYANIDSQVVTNVLLWWGMLIMEEAMNVWGTEDIQKTFVPYPQIYYEL